MPSSNFSSEIRPHVGYPTIAHLFPFSSTSSDSSSGSSSSSSSSNAGHPKSNRNSTSRASSVASANNLKVVPEQDDEAEYSHQPVEHEYAQGEYLIQPRRNSSSSSSSSSDDAYFNDRLPAGNVYYQNNSGKSSPDDDEEEDNLKYKRTQKPNAGQGSAGGSVNRGTPRKTKPAAKKQK